MGEGARAVDRACALLNAFTPDRPSLGLKELADRAEINKSTAHRLLTALSRAGLIHHDPASREYSPGMRLAALGNIALARLDIAKLAIPPMARLAATAREAVFLAGYEDQGVAYLAVAEGPSTIRLSANVGMIVPYNTTATGKVLLAALSPAELAKLLPRNPPRPTPKT
ncbi:MAG: hypothetical protein QOH08_274, partial [Chloroflexota bacterium]|nr:hypothetical protein [Chloroflexota bacterium]